MVKANYIRSLDEITEHTPLTLVGGPARDLGILNHAGFPVPEGFVVTTEALTEVLNRSSIFNDIVKSLEGVEETDERSREECRMSIRRQFLELSLPAVVEASIRQAYEDMAGGKAMKVMVWSSPTSQEYAEDGSPVQYAFFKGVSGADNVVKAVRGSWASLFSERAVNGRAEKDLDKSKSQMAVLIHRMMNADVSGTIFTCDPKTGDRQTVVINAVPGMGRKGISVPEIFKVERSGWTVADRSDSESGPSGLTDDFARSLARLAARVEEFSKAPQEITWCMADERFYLLRSSSMTARVSEDMAVWGGGWLGDALPEVSTPLTWSVIETMYQAALPAMFRRMGMKWPTGIEMLKNVKGRAYFNLGAVASLLATLPMVELQHVAEFKGTPLEMKFLARPQPTFSDRLKSMSAVLRMRKLINSRNKPASKALATFRENYDRFKRSDIKGRADASLYLLIDESVGCVSEFLGYVLETAQWSMLLYYGVESLLIRRCGEQFRERSCAELMCKLFSGIEGIRCAEPMIEVWRLGRLVLASELTELLRTRRQYNDFAGTIKRDEGGGIFQKRLESFIDDFGHRCAMEAELRSPRWGEDDEAILVMIEKTLSAPETADPSAKSPVVKSAARMAAEEAETMLPFAAKLAFRWMLRKGRAALFERDKMQFYMALGYQWIRSIFEEAGRRFVERSIIEERNDVFFLTMEEVKKLLGMQPFTGEPKDMIKARKTQYGALSTINDLPDVIVGDLPEEEVEKERELASGDSEFLQGLGASPGKYTGKAAVVRKPEDYLNLEPGVVVVAKKVDCNLSPFLTLAGAVVTETGGPLSGYAAIVREASIPSVAAVINACARIEDGMPVTVDGASGRVWLKPQEGEEEKIEGGKDADGD